MTLSILICTLPARKEMFDALVASLQKQQTDEVEILYDQTSGVSTGAKRNTLLQSAKGDYVCFIDDDDTVSERYVITILNALKAKPDCCSLKGIITTDGRNVRTFEHSVAYKRYFEKDGVYYRPPNHLNAIRKDIAQRFKFPDKTFSEDTDWAMMLCRSGMLRTESKLPHAIYHYRYRTKK